MRKYLIIEKVEMNKIDYSQIPQTEEVMIFNIEETKTFIKWDTEEDPTFVADFIFKEGPYNNEEILNIIASPEWYKTSLPDTN